MIETVKTSVAGTPVDTGAVPAVLPPVQKAASAALPPVASASRSGTETSQTSVTEAKSETGSPSSTGQTIFDGMANALTWAKDKCVGAACSIKDHVAQLKDVRSVSDFKNWATDFASDAWKGITSTVSEAKQGVTNFYRTLTESYRPAPAESPAQTIAKAIDVAVATVQEKKEQARLVQQEEADARLKRADKDAYHSGLREKLLYAIECAPKFIDRETLQTIQLAILTNHIPPERMPEVRRFLQQVEQEERSKRSGRRTA